MNGAPSFKARAVDATAANTAAIAAVALAVATAAAAATVHCVIFTCLSSSFRLQKRIERLALAPIAFHRSWLDNALLAKICVDRSHGNCCNDHHRIAGKSKLVERCSWRKNCISTSFGAAHSLESFGLI